MKIKFNKTGINAIPVNKPIVYRMDTAGGKTNYVGVAKRGRPRKRLSDHLPNGSSPIPAKTVRVKQYSSIAEARVAEKRTIKRKQPKYNTRCK